MTNGLRYPKKSHRKVVTLPAPSESLAEFFGILLGDGGINNPWQVNITVNRKADAAYIPFVVGIMEKLFSKKPRVMYRKDSLGVVISLDSTTVVDFLVSKGAVRGNKLKGGICIPPWILRNKKYLRACLRGLFDTDGCCIVHTHRVQGKTYKNIYLSFCSASPVLLTQVTHALMDLGLRPHITTGGREVYLYSAHDVSVYFTLVKTSNDRLKKKYVTWRDG